MCDCMAVDFAEIDLDTTVELMTSSDPKVRLVGEAMQNIIRLYKLRKEHRDICNKVVVPNSPIFLLILQMQLMEALETVYDERTKNEGIDDFYQFYQEYLKNIAKNKAEEEKQ